MTFIGFFGMYNSLSLDDKWRITIPSEIRDACSPLNYNYLIARKDGEIIKIYHPYLIKNEVLKNLEKKEDDKKREEFFSERRIIPYWVEGGKLTLTQLLNEQEIIENVGKLKEGEGYNLTMIGNGDHLSIDVKSIKKHEKGNLYK